MDVQFTRDELVAIYQMCCNFPVRLFSQEYFLLKNIAEKIIKSGVINQTQVGTYETEDKSR